MIIYDHLCTSILALNAYSIIFAYSFLASSCKKNAHQLMFEMFAHQAFLTFLTSDLHQIFHPPHESRCGWNLTHSQGSMLWPEKLDGEIDFESDITNLQKSPFFLHFFRTFLQIHQSLSIFRHQSWVISSRCLMFLVLLDFVTSIINRFCPYCVLREGCRDGCHCQHCGRCGQCGVSYARVLQVAWLLSWHVWHVCIWAVEIPLYWNLCISGKCGCAMMIDDVLRTKAPE